MNNTRKSIIAIVIVAAWFAVIHWLLNKGREIAYSNEENATVTKVTEEINL